MQRVRVGLTGLGAVLLIVAVSAAIFESARKEPAAGPDTAATRSEQTVANIVGNTIEPPAEPLAEMGVTPGVPAVEDNATTPPSK